MKVHRCFFVFIFSLVMKCLNFEIIVRNLCFRKPESDNSSLMIAQCHLKLGELGLEVEDYTQAIGDLNECLTIQQVCSCLCNVSTKQNLVSIYF